MDRRWGLLIIISSLILLVIIIYFIFFYNFGPNVIEPSVENNPVVKEKIKIEPTTDKPTPNNQTFTNNSIVLSTDEKDKISLQRLASSFAERYGSFSNQSDFGNIRDLEIFMSARLSEQSEKSVNELRAKKTDYEKYSGVTTKSLSSEINYFLAKSKAEVIVQTRKRENSATDGQVTSYSQPILLKFIYENGSWKVDEAIWQAKTDG